MFSPVSFLWLCHLSVLLSQRVLDISRYLLEDLQDSDDSSGQEIEEAEHKLLQLRTVLEMCVLS